MELSTFFTSAIIGTLVFIIYYLAFARGIGPSLLRGMLYMGKLQYLRAINEFDRVISLSPKYALAYALRGKCYLHLGKHQDAIDSCSTAIALAPERSVIAFPHRGDAYAALGQFDKAVEDYDAVLKLDPNCAPWIREHREKALEQLNS
ncbi:MAG: tetratricopeptide repeat protein [Candidatus Obscuribacterales bacterium]|nr:tetratricopeptide repeat protein [Candidatus Obscuribacterales bacterium]